MEDTLNSSSTSLQSKPSPSTDLRIESAKIEKKRTGSTYTPVALAHFVAKQIGKRLLANRPRLRVLDPAVGDGELLLAIIEELSSRGIDDFEIHGFDTNASALVVAEARIAERFPQVSVCFRHDDFLSHVTERFSDASQTELFGDASIEKFDVIIANPPYVRTQVLGGAQATRLAETFDLTGRVDLYHAFIFAMSAVLKDGGEFGLIVSNRFMTTRAGEAVRDCLVNRFSLHHVFDLGDTKLFEEAVLPAVIIGTRTDKPTKQTATFATSYETPEVAAAEVFDSVLSPVARGFNGVASVGKKYFKILHGTLDSGISPSDVWKISTPKSRDWLTTVNRHQRSCFRDLGKIRVGVKTTADKVFIRRDWDELDVKPEEELLLPLLTHKQAARWKGHERKQPKILYTHRVVNGKRAAIDLKEFPKAAAYLEGHRPVLEGREYVTKSGREWFEVWVPQNPALWSERKLVFRDIAEQNTFFVDAGSVVNGDCYWLVPETRIDPDAIWLALAVANSTFVLKFYDERFNNKLYANRRRFMSQYVEQFPLPDRTTPTALKLIELAKQAYQLAQGGVETDLVAVEEEADELVWSAFGLVKERLG